MRVLIDIIASLGLLAFGLCGPGLQKHSVSRHFFSRLHLILKVTWSYQALLVFAVVGLFAGHIISVVGVGMLAWALFIALIILLEDKPHTRRA